MTDTTRFDRFRPVLLKGVAAMHAEEAIVDSDDDYVCFYTPFEHENPHAELVVVGMTPGKDQHEAAYAYAPTVLSTGPRAVDALARLKQRGAFAGQLRGRLEEMLEHFDIPKRLGLKCALDLWDSTRGQLLFYPTSVVPNAAFSKTKKDKNGSPAMFTGTFEDIENSQALSREFTKRCLPALRRIGPQARYIGLGATARAALERAHQEGAIEETQILGTFAHPSRTADVAVFLHKRDPESYKPGNPLRTQRQRVANLRKYYDNMWQNVQAWRPLLAATGARVTRVEVQATSPMSLR